MMHHVSELPVVDIANDPFIKHMREFHPDSQRWGDSGVCDLYGNWVWRKCQLCGRMIEDNRKEKAE